VEANTVRKTIRRDIWNRLFSQYMRDDSLFTDDSLLNEGRQRTARKSGEAGRRRRRGIVPAVR